MSEKYGNPFSKKKFESKLFSSHAEDLNAIRNHYNNQPHKSREFLKQSKKSRSEDTGFFESLKLKMNLKLQAIKAQFEKTPKEEKYNKKRDGTLAELHSKRIKTARRVEGREAYRDKMMRQAQDLEIQIKQLEADYQNIMSNPNQAQAKNPESIQSEIKRLKNEQFFVSPQFQKQIKTSSRDGRGEQRVVESKISQAEQIYQSQRNRNNQRSKQEVNRRSFDNDINIYVD